MGPTAYRAAETSTRPEPTRPCSPFAPCQSRTRQLAGIPRAASATIAGHASSVDSKRPTTLFEGISRSEYPIAPSTRISNGSPGFRAYRPRWKPLKSVTSGISTSSSPCVFIAFALRGAPCRDDTRAWPVLRGYHEQESAQVGPADCQEPDLQIGVLRIDHDARQLAVQNGLSLQERHSMLEDVGGVLVGVPLVLRHAPDTTDRHSPATYFGIAFPRNRRCRRRPLPPHPLPAMNGPQRSRGAT